MLMAPTLIEVLGEGVFGAGNVLVCSCLLSPVCLRGWHGLSAGELLAKDMGCGWKRFGNKGGVWRWNGNTDALTDDGDVPQLGHH